MPRTVLEEARFHAKMGVPTVLRLVLALHDAGASARVSELAEAAEIKPARASQILGELREMGIVEGTKKGVTVSHRIAKPWRGEVAKIRKSVDLP